MAIRLLSTTIGGFSPDEIRCVLHCICIDQRAANLHYTGSYNITSDIAGATSRFVLIPAFLNVIPRV